MRLITLPPSCAIVMKSGNLNFLEPSGPLQASNGTSLPLPFYLYVFKLKVVIHIKSYRNSAIQQALHFSSPVISVGFLRVVFLLHHIQYTIFQRLSKTQILILKIECVPTLIYFPDFKISVSFSACKTRLTNIYHLMNEFNSAGAFIKCIARYHVMQPF
jgi:hypothetical protein